MKNEKKKVWKSITVIAVVLSVLAVAMVGATSAKSLYAIANHHTAQFDAWNINPDGTATYQFKVNLGAAHWPADIAIDESSNVLFITSEGGTMVEMVDATTMTILGHTTPSGATTGNAGVEADDTNDIVYVMQRGSPKIYALDWNPSTNSLTLKSGYPKTLTSGGYGIALDETTGILWVADGTNGKARAYSTATWTEDTSKSSSTLIHKPVDIAVDRQSGFVYTVSMTYGAGVPFGAGSNKLSKYDWSTGTETWGYLSGGASASTHHGVGVAVDEVTGYVYITTQNPYSLEVWDTSSPSWTLVDSDSVSGSPAGVCIPQAEVSYNPLGLAKDDGLGGACVYPSNTITYTMSYTNGNPTTVTGVTLVDTLPPEVNYVSCTGTGGCTQAGNTVTWSNIGSLTPGQSGSATLTVTVKAGTAGGTVIDNAATINANEANTGPTTVHELTTVCSVGGGNCCVCPAGSDMGDPCECTQAADRTACENNLGTWVGSNGCTLGTTTGCEGLYCQDGACIPEFSTIAIPVASILGLLFFFNYRKRRREQ